MNLSGKSRLVPPTATAFKTGGGGGQAPAAAAAATAAGGDQHPLLELLPPRMALSILPDHFCSYVSPSGDIVRIDQELDGLETLNIPDTSGKNGQVAFRRLVKNSDRQSRVHVGIAYLLVLERPICAIHLMAAAGNTQAIKELGEIDPNCLHAPDQYGRTPLYLAARSGFVDLCTYLLTTQRCNVNAQQGDGSTALHAACFFSQRPVAEMLLEAGANPNIKNNYGSTPQDETSSSALKTILFFGKSKCPVRTLRQQCVDEKAVGSFTELHYTSKATTSSSGGPTNKSRSTARTVPVGFIAHRPVAKELMTEFENYPVAFHGTQAKHVSSILKHGLRPSGSKLPGEGKDRVITPPSNHYSLGSKHGGIDDWARAIFLTPSVTYAAHPCYAEAILDADCVRYRVIVIARVKPDSFKTYSSTVSSHVPMAGEKTDRTEFRVNGAPPAVDPKRAVEDVMPGESTTGEIMRVDLAYNVIVTGVLLLRQSFVENLPADVTLDSFKELLDEGTNVL